MDVHPDSHAGAPRRGRAGCRLHQLVGAICSAGFASGDRVVVGHWEESPLGPLTDVMWARPDGERRLLVPTPEAAALVTAVYEFDRTVVVPVEARFDGRHLDVHAGLLRVSMWGHRGWPVPLGRGRPAWVTRWLEGPVAAGLLGVRTYGVSSTGVHEWYRADEYRPVATARASVDGADLGPLRPLRPPVRFGFSEPPRRPSIVRVRPLLWDPSGRLDEVLAGIRRAR